MQGLGFPRDRWQRVAHDVVRKAFEVQHYEHIRGGQAHQDNGHGKGGSLRERFGFHGALWTVRLLTLLDRLGIQGDLDLVANHNATPIHCAVPSDAKVVAIDLGGRGKTGA